MLQDTCPLDENIVTQIYVSIMEAMKYIFDEEDKCWGEMKLFCYKNNYRDIKKFFSAIDTHNKEKRKGTYIIMLG